MQSNQNPIRSYLSWSMLFTWKMSLQLGVSKIMYELFYGHHISLYTINYSEVRFLCSFICVTNKFISAIAVSSVVCQAWLVWPDGHFAFVQLQNLSTGCERQENEHSCEKQTIIKKLKA